MPGDAHNARANLENGGEDFKAAAYKPGGAPLDNPAVQAIADALMTPHMLNFGSVYVADRLRAEVIAMHVADVLELHHWEIRYVGPG